MKIEKSMLTGSTPLLILSLLKDEDKYGYQMAIELDNRSDHTFELKEGTMYPLLHALEKKKYVKSYFQKTPAGRERRYYHLTEDGKAYLAAKTEEWKFFTEKVNKVIGVAPCAM